MSKTMRIIVTFGDFKGDEEPGVLMIDDLGGVTMDITTETGDKLTDEYDSTFLCNRGWTAVKKALIQRGEI